MLSRRQLLMRGATGVAGLTAAGLLPRVALAAGASGSIGTIDPAQLREWCHWLDGLGLRNPGSEAQDTYIDFLADQLERVGVLNVRKEPITIHRYQPDQATLKVGGQPVRIGSYVPYSGLTPPQGITGELKYVPSLSSLERGSLEGKIALIDMPPEPIPLAAFKTVSYYIYDPDHTMAGEIYDRPIFYVTRDSLLSAAVSAGASAAVVILPWSRDLSDGQWLPTGAGFGPHGEPTPGTLPAHYVDRDTGLKLKRQALLGAQATLVLSGTSGMVASSNVVGEIPGLSKETILLNSHTDGQNAVEENGPFGILQICQQLSKSPCLPKSVTVVLTSGHFAGYRGAHEFIAAHPDIIAKAAANVTVEHLGTMEWAPDLTGDHYALNRLSEPGSLQIPANKALMAECITYLHRYDLRRHGILRNFSPDSADNRVVPLVGIGESIPFQGAGIPSVQYGSAPSYLVNTIPVADKLDYNTMWEEVQSFVQTIWNLGHRSAAELRTADAILGYPTSGGVADDAVSDVKPARDIPMAC